MNLNAWVTDDVCVDRVYSVDGKLSFDADLKTFVIEAIQMVS
jgi:hypothetical protein